MALYHRLVNFKNVLKRKHPYSEEDVQRSRFKRFTRCMNRWELTNLGLGNTLGIGIYVLVGAVAVRVAGPSIVLSFLIAAVASLLAGLCYAEFGSRVPEAGTAYMYMYVTIGEFLAFLIGWNLILEGVFGTASIAKGMSTYFDCLIGGDMYEFFIDAGPINSQFPWLSNFFDMFAFFTILLFGLLLAFGVRQSVFVTNVCAIINLLVILFLIIAGLTKVDVKNWTLNITEVVDIEFDAGVGGFFPYGIWGTFKGAAVCFYGFAGFDIMSSSDEEIHADPRRIIPHAIMTVLGVALFLYIAVAAVVTLMVPYYLLDKVAAIATAFTYLDMDWARIVIALGGTIGIYSSLFAAMFLLPRVIHTMSVDRLMPKCFAYVHPKRKTAVFAIMVPTVVIAIISSLLDIEHMISIMCVGTLFSYTIVGACVIVLRYRSKDMSEKPCFLAQLFGCGTRKPCRMSSRCANVTLTLFIILCIANGFTFNYGMSYEYSKYLIISLHALLLLCLLTMTIQPQDKDRLPPFKVPLVPLMPLMSIYLNINLMVCLDVKSLVQVFIWIAIGIITYLLFICVISKERRMHFRSRNILSHPSISKHDTMKETVNGSRNNNNVPITQTVNLEIMEDNTSRKDNVTDRRDSVSNNKDNNRLSEENNRPHRERTQEPTDKDLAMTEIIVANELQQKEAKIIDLLDQVLKAEEDSYIEIINLKEDPVENLQEETIEDKNMIPINVVQDSIPQRKSYGDLSDAGSDASLGNQVLSKYDVIVQVHREDLPKVDEDNEKKVNGIGDDNAEHEDWTAFNNSETNSENKVNGIAENNEIHEEWTAFNDSETNSRTDESGYSDTIDKSALNDSTEEAKENIPYIPDPPPFDENYFTNSNSQTLSEPERANTADNMTDSTEDAMNGTYNIPTPPPLDENYFASPYFIKSYTISSPKMLKPPEPENESKPRESVQSNNSQSSYDGTIVFGSDRQMSFMSKLDVIFKNKINGKEDDILKRSNSAGDVKEALDVIIRERPSIFQELNKEILANHSTPNLRPVNAEDKGQADTDDDEGNSSLSREDLKSKLENIYAGGLKPIKARLLKSTPITSDESLQNDVSSAESIPKLPKMEKNDTLKRQKDKFNAVLNSFRLSLNKDDAV